MSKHEREAEFWKLFDRLSIALIMDETFYGQLLCSMEVKLTTDIPTLGVDGVRIYVNPDFFLSLPKPLQLSALVHELLHLVFEHPWRRGSRDPKVWNFACDYEINPVIKDYGRPIGDKWLYKPEYKDMPAELIYKDLMSRMTPQQMASIPSFDNVMDPPGDEIEAGNQRAEMQATVMKAAAISQQHGSLPGFIQARIDAMKVNRLPWHEMLASFMRKLTFNDYAWNKPDIRTLLKTGVYAPRLFKETIRQVACGVDWSGSMSDGMIGQINTHTNHILIDVNPEEIRLLHFDTRVSKDEIKTPADLPVLFECLGRGGTDFRCVFSRLSKDSPPDVLLMFTDTWGNFPDHAPEYPVIWITDQKGAKVPFGEVVVIE